MTDRGEPAAPNLTKVTIYQIAERPWGWLMTTAEVDDRVYVGSREWREQHPEEWAATLKARSRKQY
jgi:hypothetical protein